MKKQYPGWYPRTAAETAALWDRAIFVTDTNVLLHCLRHPAEVRDELLRLLGALKTSLWIPYQVGLEFHRNRLEVEFGAQDAYESLIKDLDTIFERARERLRQLRAHPTISVAKELAALDMFTADFRARMLALRISHPSAEIADSVGRLTELLEGRVGGRWKPEQISALRKEGEDRYAKKIPPGYKDSKKDAGEFDKFGDLIIWKEMIAKAKVEKRPIIFISDDSKEDWWWIHKGRKLGARPELIEEFHSDSGQDFHIYEFSQFLRFAADRFPGVRTNVAHVEESLLADEEARRRQTNAAEALDVELQLRQLEDERDQIIASLVGTPGSIFASQGTDRSELRRRLNEVNLEINVLSNKDTVSPNDLSSTEGRAN